MSLDDHARWASVSDGTITATITLYEALKFNQTYETIGGASVLRMLNGAALKQTNWQKLRTTLAGAGGLPPALADLNYSLPLTIKSGVPRAIQRSTNSFPSIPPHRTDTGYAPTVYQLLDGLWRPISEATGGVTPSRFLMMYYPQLTCFAEPPKETYTWDESTPSSWSLTAEEM